MIDCTRLDQQLDAYLANRLPLHDAEALEAHAARCERCAEVLERATRVDHQFASEIAPPAGVRDRVLAAIRPARVVKPAMPRWFIPAAAAATVLIVLSLGGPPTKSGQVPGKSPSSAIADERADALFEELDAAEAELTAALRATPNDEEIKQALSGIAAKRKALQTLVKEYES